MGGSSIIIINWCAWVHDYTADFWAVSLRPRLSMPRRISAVSPPSPTPHSPVLVNSADMLHATKRTLQIKHTCTKSISLLLRTLNIFAIIVFLDALTVSSRSMLRSSAGGHFFASLRAEETAAPLASSHGTLPGCGPHFKPSRAQMESSKTDRVFVFCVCFFFPPCLRRWEDAFQLLGLVDWAMTRRSNSDIGLQINSAMLQNSDSARRCVSDGLPLQPASCPVEREKKKTSAAISFYPYSFCVWHKMRQCPVINVQTLSCAVSQTPSTCVC